MSTLTASSDDDVDWPTELNASAWAAFDFPTAALVAARVYGRLLLGWNSWYGDLLIVLIRARNLQIALDEGPV